MVIRKNTLYWVDLGPEPAALPEEERPRRSKPRRMQPCVVVSPDELNQYLDTVMVAPLSQVPESYPWRPTCNVKGRRGSIALDQIRTVRKEKLNTAYGRLSKSEVKKLQEKLYEMFG